MKRYRWYSFIKENRNTELEKELTKLACALLRLCKAHGLDYGTIFLNDDGADTVVNISVKSQDTNVVNMYTIVR